MGDKRGTGSGTLHERIELARQISCQDAGAARPTLESIQRELDGTGTELDADAWIKLSSAWIYCSSFDRAVASANSAIRVAGEQQDVIREAKAWQVLAVAYWRLCSIDQAVESLDQAKQLLGQGPHDPELQALVCGTEGLIRAETEEYELALVSMLDSRAHWVRVGDLFRIARNASNISRVHRRMGNYVGALELGLEARRAFDLEKHPRSCAILALNLAEVHFDLGDMAAAQGEAQTALAGCHAVDSTGFHLSVEVILARICSAANDRVSALRHASLVADAPDETFSTAKREVQLDSVARVFLAEGEFERGFACIERAQGASEGKVGRGGLSSALLTHIELYLATGQVPAARKLLGKAFHLQGAHSMTLTNARLLKAASRAAESVGDLAEALEYERRFSLCVGHLKEARAEGHLKNLRVIHQLERSNMQRKDLERSQSELKARGKVRAKELALAYQDLEHETRERERAEHKRRELEFELQQALRTQSLARLAGGVAHDFNNLLTVISGCTDVIGHELPTGSHLAVHVRELQLAIEHGTGLTRRLLGFAGRDSATMEPCRVEDLFESVLFFLEYLVADDLELEIETVARGERVVVNHTLLDSVLMNLALNARDAMPQGGRLSIKTHLEKSATGYWFVVAVRDTGHGISEQRQRRIFEPYFSTKSKGEGTGLGLFSARSSIREMEGDLTLVESSPAGSCFEVRLPVLEKNKPSA